MNKRPPFTKEEDDIIIKFAKNYPTNLSEAFRRASVELPERSKDSITKRWYNIRKKDGVHILTVGSNKGFTQNVKNVAINKEGNMREQGLKHYMYIMKELLELTPVERKVIIDFFKLAGS